MNISFRPHHFLCALSFRGEGYSPQFIANFSGIMRYLNSSSGENALINVVGVTDSICAPCPSKRNDHCISQKKITNLDKAHAEILNIQSGDKISWKDAKQRIADRVTLEKFHQACAPCEWKKFGWCEEVIKIHINAN